ncbi:MAG: signal peptidase II [Chlorobiales bacterium]|nr:signal peptidase II [Chlorobiales bacterium]
MRIFLIVLSVIALDQATKLLAKDMLFYGPGEVSLIGDWLKFTYTENRGIAFGIELGGPLFVTFFAILATIGIVYYLYRSRRDNVFYTLAFSLILGGAIGNLIDRIVYGQVIDFIHFDLYRGYIFGKFIALWPIFNVADMAISFGVAILIIWYHKIFEENPAQAAHPEKPISAQGSGDRRKNAGTLL